MDKFANTKKRIVGLLRSNVTDNSFIAKKLGITVSAVKRHRSAMKKVPKERLKKMLENQSKLELNPKPKKVKQPKKVYTSKKELVELSGGKCAMCGYNKCLRALEFHHLDPTIKTQSIFHMLTNKKSKIEILEEVAKCQLLCSNCHREAHARMNENSRLLKIMCGKFP